MSDIPAGPSSPGRKVLSCTPERPGGNFSIKQNTHFIIVSKTQTSKVQSSVWERRKESVSYKWVPRSVFPREDGEAQTPVLSAHSQRSAGRRAVEAANAGGSFKERGPRGLVEGGGLETAGGRQPRGTVPGKGTLGLGHPHDSGSLSRTEACSLLGAPTTHLGFQCLLKVRRDLLKVMRRVNSEILAQESPIQCVRKRALLQTQG